MSLGGLAVSRRRRRMRLLRVGVRLCVVARIMLRGGLLVVVCCFRVVLRCFLVRLLCHGSSL